MGADLHIHVLEGIEEADLASFNSNTLGSKYFNPRTIAQGSGLDKFSKIAETPDIWIGEVSWLKAAMFEDRDTFVPNTVAEIHELIGEELPELTDELTKKILAAFSMKNETAYSLAKKDDVEAFLAEHQGKQLFTVSW